MIVGLITMITSRLLNASCEMIGNTETLDLMVQTGGVVQAGERQATENPQCCQFQAPAASHQAHACIYTVWMLTVHTFSNHTYEDSGSHKYHLKSGRLQSQAICLCAFNPSWLKNIWVGQIASLWNM